MLRSKFLIILLLLIAGGAYYTVQNRPSVLGSIAPEIQNSLEPIMNRFSAKQTNNESSTSESIESENDTDNPNTDSQAKQLSESLGATLDETLKTAGTDFSTLSEKTVEVTKHTQNVLGSSITAVSEEEQTPLHEKAMEYGQYVYCKQVVSEYEKQDPELKK